MADTYQKKIYTAATGQPKETQELITVGVVVDTNDPQQMGRVRVVCPTWGDSYTSDITDLPWALYVTPFGGQTSVGTRGPGIQSSEGGVSYGMWAIPKVGAQVLVMCVDGDPQHRIYLGCLFDQYTPHTMPHGRWKYDDHPSLEKTSMNAAPFGPYTSREKFIEPLAENLREAFAYKSEPNHEWRSRAADYQVAAIDVSHVNFVKGSAPDDKQIQHDDWNSTQGYQVSRIDPLAPTSVTAFNNDSLIYSWTTPGFHAMSMDDRQENCRIRFRTTSGHQIIMDDTNERIYIQTAKGNNWIELDQAGNIDMYTDGSFSVRAKKGINFTSDDTIRMHAANGIHMYSGGDVRMQAATDIHAVAANNIHAHADMNVNINAEMDINVLATSSLNLNATSVINVLSDANLNLNAVDTINMLATGPILQTGATIQQNGTPAEPADPAAPSSHQPAKWTYKVPNHEPYGRCTTANDFTHAPELEYNDERMGRYERGRAIIRGRYWRR